VPDDLRVALAERYDLERELGHGAMAVVYLARDLRYDRRVAVKVLTEEMAAAVGRERFRREIEIVARLNHPHILPLLDSGDAQGFLYYVMPYAEGGSLRDRLDRETQLAIPDAIGIVRDVALALEHAHRLGFIHRDVKPENILFSNGYALIADFGIARVAEQVGDNDRLTQSGISPGTPTYMSPEQAAGEGGVDGRSDLYSLACVLYELLAGQPPFSGPSVQAVLARHRFNPVPPLRTVRRTVSPGLERVVLRALEKVPADRQKSAAEFVAALEAVPMAVDEPPWWQKPMVVASLVLLLAFVVALVFHWVPIPQAATAPADTTRYVILPFEREAGITSSNEEQLLHDALGRWSGITVVDPFQVRDAIVQVGETATTRAAERVAERLKAGRYVRGEVSRAGDSFRVYGGVYDATSGALIHDGAVKVSPDLRKADSTFDTLAEKMLFGPTRAAVILETRAGTSSRPARQAFESGLAAIEQWDLALADSGFAVATRFDPDYAQAFLWLAIVRSWSDLPLASWQSAARRAAARNDRLSSRDRAFSEALLQQARGDVEVGCRMWNRLAEKEGNDFVSWYGSWVCLHNDDIVVRDTRTRSGWAFRSSYYQATRAFRQALLLLPSIHTSFRAEAYLPIRGLLMTSSNARRTGRAVPPDTETFRAYPTWEGDSLVFIPYPTSFFQRPTQPPPAKTLAIRRQREVFREIATGWVAAYPRSADAVEALAVSLALLGDVSALDTLKRARTLAVSPEESVRVGGLEVWLRVLFSIPSDVTGCRAAKGLADSLLFKLPPDQAPDATLLASLAALTGRARLMAALLRRPEAIRKWDVPRPLVETALPLTGFAALGGPLDTLQDLERRVSATIETELPAPLRKRQRLLWLARPATLAFPAYEFSSIPRLVGQGDYLLDAQAAFLRGDTVTVKQLFADLGSARRFERADVTLDALYPEALLLSLTGDVTGAVEWLEPTLDGLRTAEPELFLDPTRAAALVRAAALRADLADRIGDHEQARRWATVVSILWSDADAFLQPIVRRMNRLSG
jgi:tRNA A-37 threonylcarbamoyl transferase component Bud32